MSLLKSALNADFGGFVFFSYCRRIINLRCISAIYADRDTIKVQDTHY